MCQRSQFQRQFYNKDWRHGDVVPVKGTTCEAFATFLDMIYKKEEIEWDLEKKTIVCLFETLKLAEKYQVEAIADIINRRINSFQVTRKNVLALAAIAEHYNVFGQVCTCDVDI